MNGIGTISDLQLFDADEVRRTVELLLPAGQVTELRILDAVTTSDRRPHTASGYFDDTEKLISALESVRAAKAFYLIPNPVNPALLARAANRICWASKGGTTSDHDIVRRHWLLVDCDPQRPAGISATDAEHEAAIERCRVIWNALHYNYAWPEPAAGDSGNGGHLLYRVDLPVDDDGLIQRCLSALAAQFDDGAVKVDAGVFNPARIWKLYGSRACKGDSTSDRPHRMSRILSTPEHLVIVSRELLEELASEAPAAAPHETIGAAHSNGSAFDVDSFIQRHGFEVAGPDSYQGGRKWTFRRSPLCEHHDDGPYLIQFASGALSAGCHHNSCAWTWHDLRAKHEPKADSSLYDRLLAKASGKTSGDGNSRNLTDVGNSERFAQQHGSDLRYCHPWDKWLAWDGRRWAIDDSGEVVRRAKLTARSIYAEASRAADKDDAKEIAKWASQGERRERLAAMIALAESERPVPIAVETLDAEPWLLNCINGTLDLRTGMLREHRREDFLTKLCPVEYPTETVIAPKKWLAFLNRISTPPLIEFLQRLVGMALVGEVLENILAIFYGAGANGKSVFLETICGMLGSDYAMTASTSLLMVDRMGRHPTERTDLHGRRFVAAIETGDAGRLSEETVKQLTSREAIRARRMREDFWEFAPSHTVMLATNHKPEVRGTDYGIWRRLRLVPFDVVIPEAERDRELANKLKAEWPAILRWAVAGCLDWQRNGLQAPKEVLKATDDYRADMDVLGEFLEERCIADGDCEARATDLYRSYKAWAEKRGEHVLTQTKFGTRLSERGFTKSRDSKNLVVYRGIGLLPEGPDSPEGFS